MRTATTYRYGAGLQRFGLLLAGAMIILPSILVAAWDGATPAARVAAGAIAVFLLVLVVLVWRRVGGRSVVLDGGTIRVVGFGQSWRCELRDVRLVSVARYTHRGDTELNILLWVPAVRAGRTAGSRLVRLGLDEQSREAKRSLEERQRIELAPFIVPLTGLSADGVAAVVAAIAPLDVDGELDRRLGVSPPR